MWLGGKYTSFLTMQLVLVLCSVATLLATCWASNQETQPEVGVAPALIGNFLYNRQRRHALLGLGLPITLGSKGSRGLKKKRKDGGLLGDIVDIKGPLVAIKVEDSKESAEQQTKPDRQSKPQGRAAAKSTTAPPTTIPSVILSTSTAEASKEPSIVQTTVQEPSTTDTTVQEPSTTQSTTREPSTTETTTGETSTTTGETYTTTVETSTTAGTLETTLAPDQVSTTKDSNGTDATATEKADMSGSMKLIKSEPRPQAGPGSVQEAGQDSRSIGGVGNLFNQKFNQLQALFTFDQLAQAAAPPKPANIEEVEPAYPKSPPVQYIPPPAVQYIPPPAVQYIAPPVQYIPPPNPSLPYKEIIRQLPDNQRLPDSPRPIESSVYPSWSVKPVPSPYSTYLENKMGPSEFEALYRANKLPTPAIVPPRPPRPPKAPSFDYDGEDPFFAG